MTSKSIGYTNVIDDNKNDDENEADRFVHISTREDRSDIDQEAWADLTVKNAYKQKWKDAILNKGPTEIALYPMLFHELKPETIIELGALHGGGAIWMADMCSMLGLETNIISVDIDLNLLSQDAVKDHRVNFVEGDINHIEEIAELQNPQSWKHPWMIIDDCHVNTKGVLEFFKNNGAIVGDYIIVEDTNQDAWDAWKDNWMDEDRVNAGKQKIVKMREWLMLNNEWMVDTKYTDQFGYNGTKNWNSVLRKMA